MRDRAGHLASARLVGTEGGPKAGVPTRPGWTPTPGGEVRRELVVEPVNELSGRSSGRRARPRRSARECHDAARAERRVGETLEGRDPIGTPRRPVSRAYICHAVSATTAAAQARNGSLPADRLLSDLDAPPPTKTRGIERPDSPILVGALAVIRRAPRTRTRAGPPRIGQVRRRRSSGRDRAAQFASGKTATAAMRLHSERRLAQR